jgi:hypothetical protein
MACKHHPEDLYSWVTEATLMIGDDNSIVITPDGKNYYVADMMWVGCRACGHLYEGQQLKKYTRPLPSSGPEQLAT